MRTKLQKKMGREEGVFWGGGKIRGEGGRQEGGEKTKVAR